MASTQSPYLTGDAVLTFQMWDEGDSKTVKKGVELLDKNSEFKFTGLGSNLSYNYYKIQAMLNYGESSGKNTTKRPEIHSLLAKTRMDH